MVCRPLNRNRLAIFPNGTRDAPRTQGGAAAPGEQIAPRAQEIDNGDDKVVMKGTSKQAGYMYNSSGTNSVGGRQVGVRE